MVRRIGRKVWDGTRWRNEKEIRRSENIRFNSLFTLKIFKEVKGVSFRNKSRGRLTSFYSAFWNRGKNLPTRVPRNSYQSDIWKDSKEVK